MDNSAKKWLVRAGSLFVLAGFFIPFKMIYPAPGTSEGMSFSTVAFTEHWIILFFVPVGALAAIIFSFLLHRNNRKNNLLMLGEGAGLALGILSLLIIALIHPEQYEKVNIELFVLLSGYVFGGIGIIMELFEPAQPASQPQDDLLPDFESAFPYSEYTSPAEAPRLELIDGNTVSQIITISNSDFHIGRNSQNHYSVNDSQVSRLHIRIREAEGSWFIQDQNSAGGTYVNEKRVQAQRLNDGDQIRIGQTTLIFHV